MSELNKSPKKIRKFNAIDNYENKCNIVDKNKLSK